MHLLHREWLIPKSSITPAKTNSPRGDIPIGTAPLNFAITAITVARAAIAAAKQGTFLSMTDLLL
jgi:hypothetical protein